MVELTGGGSVAATVGVAAAVAVADAVAVAVAVGFIGCGAAICTH